MPTALKGDTALPLVGESIGFLRDPVQFVNRRVERHGPVFVSNVLATPTVFACSYESVRELLNKEESTSLATGKAYAEFLGALYPSPNVLLLENGDARRARLLALSTRALDENAANAFRHVVRRMMQPMLQVMRERAISGDKFALYEAFKPLCARISCALVLGEHFTFQHFEKVRQLCSAHFAGIVAAPLAIRAFGRRSARASALDAHAQLAQIVASQADVILRHGDDDDEPCLLRTLLHAADVSEYELVREHAVLLLSAAIPKCLASALCSVVSLLATHGKPDKQHSKEYIQASILEALRLHPPMLGGMRIVQGYSTSVGDFSVPVGHRIWWSARHANRDGDVYSEPDHFKPERWTRLVGEREGKCPFSRIRLGNNRDTVTPLPLSFGAGQRMCAGAIFAWSILEEVTTSITKKFEVIGEMENEKLQMRYVPVCRPVNDTTVKLRRRKQS